MSPQCWSCICGGGENEMMPTSYPKKVSLPLAAGLLHFQHKVHSCEVWCGRTQRGLC